jgi:aminoglycoside phosphotransferase (APT) family kinase protein
MHEKYLGNTPETALAVVTSLYGQSSRRRIVDEGYENLIIIVDESYVVRFPRTEEVWNNSEVERYILQKLVTTADMPIPKLLQISEDPAYLVMTYLTGHQVTTKQLRSLPATTLEEMGREIATFAHKLHTRLSVDETRLHITPPSWSYDEYLQRVLIARQDPNPKLDTLAKKYYELWKQRKKTSEVVVHDDLHKNCVRCIGSATRPLKQPPQPTKSFQGSRSTGKRPRRGPLLKS